MDVSVFHDDIRRRCATMIQGLVALQPKKRKSKVSWVLLSGLVYVVGALAIDGSVRETLLSSDSLHTPPAVHSDIVTQPRPTVAILAARTNAQNLPTVQAPLVQLPAPGVLLPVNAAAMQANAAHLAQPATQAEPAAAPPKLDVKPGKRRANQHPKKPHRQVKLRPGKPAERA